MTGPSGCWRRSRRVNQIREVQQRSARTSQLLHDRTMQIARLNSVEPPAIVDLLREHVMDDDAPMCRGVSLPNQLVQRRGLRSVRPGHRTSCALARLAWEASPM